MALPHAAPGVPAEPFAGFISRGKEPPGGGWGRGPRGSASPPPPSEQQGKLWRFFCGVEASSCKQPQAGGHEHPLGALPQPRGAVPVLEDGPKPPPHCSSAQPRGTGTGQAVGAQVCKVPGKLWEMQCPRWANPNRPQIAGGATALPPSEGSDPSQGFQANAAWTGQQQRGGNQGLSPRIHTKTSPFTAMPRGPSRPPAQRGPQGTGGLPRHVPAGSSPPRHVCPPRSHLDEEVPVLLLRHHHRRVPQLLLEVDVAGGPLRGLAGGEAHATHLGLAACTGREDGARASPAAPGDTEPRGRTGSAPLPGP